MYLNTFNLNIVVVHQNIWTTVNDPFTGDPTTSAGSELLINELRNYWETNKTHVDRDLVHLFTGRSFNAAGVAGRVYEIGTVCKIPDKSYGFTRDRFNQFETTAHEIGHNFGGVHGDGINCGSTNASLMCQGEKQNPMYFSTATINKIENFMNANAHCLLTLDNIKIVGNNVVCNSQYASYSLDTPLNGNINWTFSNNNFEIISGQGSPNITVKGKNQGYGEATLTVSVQGICGVISINRNLWLGVPSFTLLGTTIMDVGMPGIAIVDYSIGDHFVQGIQNSDWSFTGPLDNIEGDAMKAHYRASRREGGIGFIYSTQTNQCGSTENRLFYEVEEPFFMMVSPNPANEYTELNFYPSSELSDYQKDSKAMISVSTAEEDISTVGEYEIQIWHERKGLVKKLKSKNKKLQILTNNLDEGTYFLHVIVNGKVYKKQLMVKR